MNPVINKYGDKFWYDSDGKWHREDGPAIEKSGSTFWYKHGRFHREGGPAIEHADGRTEFWLENVRYTHEHYLFRLKILESLNKCKLLKLKDKKIEWI